MFCRTLVIEDDLLARQAMTKIIQSWGHSTLSAGTLAEAFDRLGDGPVCIVTDLNLPDGQGTEMLRHIRDHHLLVRIAVTTRSHDQELLAEVGRLHPDAFFAKPVDLRQLEDWMGEEARPDRDVSLPS